MFQHLYKGLILVGLLVMASCSSYEADKGNHIIPEKEEPLKPVQRPDGSSGVLPYLTKQGRYLANEQGKTMNLHGFTDTYSPWFDRYEGKYQWTDYDVAACLSYKKGIHARILKAGWKMNFVRLHMDPHWSNKPGSNADESESYKVFDFDRFKKYFDEVFLNMAEYYISKGYYVVMRPPGVCPEKIEIDGPYHQYLKKVWGYVAAHPKVKDNTDIMFELANEPVQIKGTDGVYSHWLPSAWNACSIFFQQIIDVIRQAGCKHNMVWVPGLCWQQQYKGYLPQYTPIKDEYYGFAVHCYPGWYGSKAEEKTGEIDGSVQEYSDFEKGWNEAIQPIANIAPIMITEMDWGPKKYDHTWGKSTTTVFGANFKKLADKTGNVSYLYFTTQSEDLANFVDVPGTPGSYTFLNDPEACCWQLYHWFKDYAAEQGW